MIIVLNYLSVLIYGVLIMAFFLNVRMHTKNIINISLCIFCCSILQFALLSVFGAAFVEKTYPLVVHIPLVFFFRYLSKKRWDTIIFVLFTAYAFTSPRRWFGDLISSLFGHNLLISTISMIVASVLLLVLIYTIIRPFMIRILEYSGAQISWITVMPALYYILAYVITVYTNTLFQSSILVIGLLSVGLNFSFYSFLAAYFHEMSKSFQSKTAQAVLQMQIDATNIQIHDYISAQKQSAIHRHDLHHHLHYISTCIAERQLEEAQQYIKKIHRAVDTARVVQYCENNSVNVILSVYAAQASSQQIDLDIHAIVPTEISIQSNDICVILANSIENALNACRHLDNPAARKICIQCIFENDKLTIEVRNPYQGMVRFENELPISMQENHGYGTKSIVAAVQKYEGLYSFVAENGTFVMRVICLASDAMHH